jgi:hypothetical protein
MHRAAWVMCLALIAAVANWAAESVTIELRHGSAREMRIKIELQRILSAYDLSKYTFTNKIVIEDRAVAHSFPVITLNTRFLDSDDELLSSFLHEQLHWHLRNHHLQTEEAIRQLRILYPRVPVGMPKGAETEYSTYGHLVDCYLEIQADRRLIGAERTIAVISHKGHYTWIYNTIFKDEAKIAAIVEQEGLGIN